MRRSSLHWIIAAGCALGAASCAEGDTDSTKELVATTKQAVSQDTTPPSLVCAQPGDCTQSTAVADAMNGPATLQWTAHLVDAPSGLQYAWVYLSNPSKTNYTTANFWAPPLSGTSQDGVYQGSLTIPQYAEPGVWTVEFLDAYDNVGNFKAYSTAELAAIGFPTTLTVLSDPDSAPPALVCAQAGDCAVSAAVADATNGPATVQWTAHLTDNKSGLSYAWVYLSNPSKTNYTTANFWAPPLSGTLQDGVYQGSLTIPQYAEPGVWTVEFLDAYDNAGNFKAYSPAELVAMGFPTTLTVLSDPDSTPPALVCAQAGDCTASPSTVDAATGPATVDWTAHLTDNKSGLSYAWVYLSNPSKTNYATANFWAPPLSGTLLDGVYQGSLTIPQYAEPGVWTVAFLDAYDHAGNFKAYSPAELVAMGFPTAIHVCHATDPCNDGNACTTGESCNAGACGSGAPVNCDDGNACTADSCDPATGCAHVAVSCDDGNPCTDDACNPAVGCTHTMNASPCDDGSACTTNDHCFQGVCKGATLACDDGNACTNDSCDPATGCAHEEREGACDDGNPCTAQDVCKLGACVGGGPTICDDGEECTSDSCDPQVGCVFAPRTGSCGSAPSTCASGGACFQGHCTVGTVCGDGVCCGEGGENHCNCPDDCDNPPGVPECGNGCCGAGEDACNCPLDCQPKPNDGLCCGNENACNSQDCGADTCGNGCCGPSETTCSCPADCGSSCNDGCCSPGEDACSCPQDCQPAPDDGLCCGAEDACNSQDCGPDTCGNGCCGDGETPCSCPADCGQVVCGDGVCAGCGEDKCSCPADCDPQGASACDKDCGSKCGDGCCGILPDGTKETACNCALDCATVCGDGCCSGDEDGCSCPADCGAPSCGDGKCEACAGETPCGCPSDCGSANDGVCCGGENGCNAPADCGPPALGNHLCEACKGETSCNAPADCTPVCGDGCCNGPEDSCNCKADCGAAYCGNGRCDTCSGETACSCPGDCGGPDACGDGLCCGGESSCGCVADCGGVIHGDAQCCANEDVCDESACGPVAPGDGLCCASENACGEPACGPGYCGDGCCEAGETACGCPDDCLAIAQPVCIPIQRGVSGSVADALLAGDYPQWATGGEQNLWFGLSDGGNENRSIYRFDLGAIPPGSAVTSATLKVWLSFSQWQSTVSARALLAPWSEATVTATTFANPALIDPVVAGTLFVDGSTGYKSMDLKALVASWVSGAKPNHGVVLSEPPLHTHHSFSSESSPSVRPKLEVCYVACGQ